MKDQVADLAQHINDKPYFHFEESPATEELIKIGLPALKYGTLVLLISSDRNTRMRAWHVVESVSMAQMGFVRGQGWPKGTNSLVEDEKWRQLWRANGSYDWDAPKEAREAAYQKWLRWLNQADSMRPSISALDDSGTGQRWFSGVGLQ